MRKQAAAGSFWAVIGTPVWRTETIEDIEFVVWGEVCREEGGVIGEIIETGVEDVGGIISAEDVGVDVGVGVDFGVADGAAKILKLSWAEKMR